MSSKKIFWKSDLKVNWELFWEVDDFIVENSVDGSFVIFVM